MAKRTFKIAPKLTEEKKSLPVQELSVDHIQEIVKRTQEKEEVLLPPKAMESKQKAKPKTVKKPKAKKKPSRPQGRPRREEAVKRISSDLPEVVYMRMKAEINRNGYTMNGFLAKVLREYFERKDKKE